MGHALQFVKTDAIARYRKLVGDDVFFLTGTDEYGSKMFRTAKEKNIDPQALVDENAAKFQEIDKLLGVEYSDFIRTTDQKRHWPGARKIWEEMLKNGDLEKRKYSGYYCGGCEAYLTKRDMENGKCPLHDKEPEFIEEENYFFKLSKYSEKLIKLIENDTIKIFPESRKKEILNFAKEGLEDISFSRPKNVLPWGIPVPGDNDHIMYVWCDALTNYISALGYGNDNPENFNKYWPADVHIIGKDNLRFHALYWPAMLLSAGFTENRLPKMVYVHGFITSGGKKMSKSIGNVVDPSEILKKYSADALRYYLLKAIPAVEDGDFTIKQFEKVYNADLANGLGNTVARVIAMVGKYVADARLTTNDSELYGNWSEIINVSKECVDYAMKEYDTPKAIDGIWHILREMDASIDTTKPWMLAKDSEKTKMLNSLLYVWLEALRNVGIFLKPFLPETSDKILKQLGFNEEKKEFKVKKDDSLFPRL